jgi:hypothetical protein
MIRKILLQKLPQAYGLCREKIYLEATVLTEDAISDTTRCANCKTKQVNQCNEQNLLIALGTAQVVKVNYESYIKQFNGTKLGSGKNCDYLLVDDSGKNYKVAFCELTCSMKENVEPDERRKNLPEGKRAKVMKQLEESVCRLVVKDEVKDYLKEFHHRHCIFGWRDPFVSNVPVIPKRGDVDANMKILIDTTSGSEPILLQHQEIGGLEFVFYQVKYPAVYKW